MVNYLDMHPWVVAAAGPFLIAAALLLASIPRRVANWRMRRSELLLEVDDIELRSARAHAETEKAHTERIRRLGEQLRAAEVLSAGIRAQGLAKIELEFRGQHEMTDINRELEVGRRHRLLEASKFTKLFADNCQGR